MENALIVGAIFGSVSIGWMFGWMFGWKLGRASKRPQPLRDQMDFCDHIKRYGDCPYCIHMTRP